MPLRDEIRELHGNRRKFVLLRLADMDTGMARKLVGIAAGTYNSWFRDTVFTSVYSRLQELSEYKQEAIQLLRRDNQLEAVLLESKILARLKEELDTKEYNLIRSNMAREVYIRLMGELDATPQTQVLSWEQRIQQIYQQGGNPNGNNYPAITEPEEKPIEGFALPKGEQGPPQSEEEDEEGEAVMEDKEDVEVA